MRKLFASLFLSINIIFLHSQSLHSQTGSPAIYHDSHGGFVYMPTGKISFADVLVSYTEGAPKAPINGGIPEVVLGEVNYDIENIAGFFTVGCGGTIIARFTDNALTDIEGADLYIFEIGSNIEATQLEISKDGVNWITVGEIGGGRAEVDIKDFVKQGEVFYYVRLTDLKSNCQGNYPGADIDAIAAIGSVVQVTLNASLLFDVGSYTLKPTALLSIDSLSAQLNSSSIKSIDITGHTDRDGSDDNNLTLSKNRANSVKTQLLKKLTDKAIVINTIGLGETQPVATNETEVGKASNRRVSMIIHPKAVNKIDRKKYEELTNVIYVLYDASIFKWFNDYPKPINKTNFGGIPTNHIDEALFYDGYTYFFNGSRVKRYNNETGVVDAKDNAIKNVFKGVGFNRVDAAIYIQLDEMICFFKDDSCILFKPENQTFKAYTLQTLFPGLGTTRPEAVMVVNQDNFMFFFDGMTQVYNYSYGQPNGEPVPISKGIWGNLWLDGPDAVMDDGKGMMCFFKNPVK